MKPSYSRYDFAWGCEVYRELTDSYPRATKLFRLISNHDIFYPVELLCRDQPKWERYKRIIKYVDRLDRLAGRPEITKDWTSWIEERLEWYIPIYARRSTND